jgi:ornithine decarboxylase
MPPLEVGDILVSPMMGAYTSVTASRFNGIPATPIVMG